MDSINRGRKSIFFIVVNFSIIFSLYKKLLGERYAEEHGVKLKIFPADWVKYKKSAGPIRNKQMIDYITCFENKMVVAFVSPNSKGTKQTVKLAQKNNMIFAAPPMNLCTDNGAMIAWAGLENFANGNTVQNPIAPRPRWPLTEL